MTFPIFHSRSRTEKRSDTMTATVRFFLLLCALLVPTSTCFFQTLSLEEQEIEVTTNPYCSNAETKEASACSVQHLLSPHLLITHTYPTQHDTFMNIRHPKIFTQPVPVYTMKQPARLNPGQLQFDLVLVRDLASHENIYEIPINVEKAMDSWFPGYSWTPIVFLCGNGSQQHVGWKFTSNNHDGSYFYALLVTVDERRQQDPIHVGGFKAAVWMMERIMT